MVIQPSTRSAEMKTQELILTETMESIGKKQMRRTRPSSVAISGQVIKPSLSRKVER